MNATTGTKRVFGLDILRAAAIIFVLQIHSLEFIRPYTDTHYYWLFILDGVDLFFVLSGFLIGGILLRAIDKGGLGWTSLTNFWIRRWFRTLPNYFLVLFILLAGYYYAFGHFPDKTLHYFIFTQNFTDPHPHFFPEAWSLAVEEWFYLLVPFGLFLLLKFGKFKRKIIFSWICFVLIAATLYRLYKTSMLPSMEGATYDADIRKEVVTRMDSIMYGFLGAYLSHYRVAVWEKWKNGFFITGLLLLFGSRWVYSLNEYYALFGYTTVQSIGTLLLLPKLNSIITGKGIIYRAVTFISIISYSLYLVHYTIVLRIIIPGIMRITGMDYEKNIIHSVIGYLLFWSIAIAISYLLYRFYEKPMMDLRERFSKKPGK